MPPRRLAALVLRSVADSVPQLKTTDIEDVIMGCTLATGEAGYNVARVAALLAGFDAVAGDRQPAVRQFSADDPDGGPRHQVR